MLDLALGDRNAGEMRDTADGGGVDGHAVPKIRRIRVRLSL
jgi:hypothetical protein